MPAEGPSITIELATDSEARISNGTLNVFGVSLTEDQLIGTPADVKGL